MVERTRPSLAVLAVAAVLAAACSSPSPRFTPTGEKYAMRKHLPGEIAVYISPDAPERPYRIIGAIFVPGMCRIDSTRAARLEELRTQAAKAGADGVMNVVFPTEQGRMRTLWFNCGCASPYSRKDSTYTKYEARADAFIWED